MPLIPLHEAALVVGEPLRLAIYDRSGLLLMPAGSVISNERQRHLLIERKPFVEEGSYYELQRLMISRLDPSVLGNERAEMLAQYRSERMRRLKEKVATRLAATQRNTLNSDTIGDCNGLELRLTNTLKNISVEDFLLRLEADRDFLMMMLEGNPDQVLFVLMHAAGREIRNYSVQHAILVATVCYLVAKELNSWSEEEVISLVSGALTMNLAIMALQDELAAQPAALSAEQRAQIDKHGLRSANLLRELGVRDENWLRAVELHHDTTPGPLAELDLSMRMARIIQRVDSFCARMSPRKTRQGLSSTAAAKTAYLSETGAPDEAGAAILKAVGLYPPGCLVRLRNQELAVVIRRGAKLNEPVVAAVANPAGHVMGKPALRNTQAPDCQVQASLTPGEVNLRLNVVQLLAMV